MYLATQLQVKHPEIEHTVRVQDFERWLEALCVNEQ